MFKEQMDKIKSLIVQNEKPNRRKIENLVVFLIILIITLIAINTILNEDNENEDNNQSIYKELANEDITANTENSSYTELEEKIEKILGTISGVRKGKCTYYIFKVVRSNCNV